MNKYALLALEGSICKWNMICMGIESDQGGTNCPLCWEYSEDYCKGCPVSEATGIDCCDNTPYSIFYKHSILDEERCLSNNLHLATTAEDELIFLLGLLPDGHKWKDQI